MLTPHNAAEMVLSYHCYDPQKAADVTLAALDAAGYAIVNRARYVEDLTQLAMFTTGVTP